MGESRSCFVPIEEVCVINSILRLAGTAAAALLVAASLPPYAAAQSFDSRRHTLSNGVVVVTLEDH